MKLNKRKRNTIFSSRHDHPEIANVKQKTENGIGYVQINVHDQPNAVDESALR